MVATVVAATMEAMAEAARAVMVRVEVRVVLARVAARAAEARVAAVRVVARAPPLAHLGVHASGLTPFTQTTDGRPCWRSGRRSCCRTLG